MTLQLWTKAAGSGAFRPARARDSLGNVALHPSSNPEDVNGVGIDRSVPRLDPNTIQIHRPLLDQAARCAARRSNSAGDGEVDDAGPSFDRPLSQTELLEILRDFLPAELRFEVPPGTCSRLPTVIQADDLLPQALLHFHRIDGAIAEPRVLVEALIRLMNTGAASPSLRP